VITLADNTKMIVRNLPETIVEKVVAYQRLVKIQLGPDLENSRGYHHNPGPGPVILITVVMILDGGSPAELFSAPQAILLTIGGAIIATIISYPMKSVKLIPKWFKAAFMSHNEEPFEVIELLTHMADKARREGLLALEEESKKIEDNFLRTGIMMVVDGTDPAQVRGILEIEIYHMQERHGQGINFFSAAGGYGPTMGIIGTVMGLISVLQELDNPGELGAMRSPSGDALGHHSANLIGCLAASCAPEEEVSYRGALKDLPSRPAKIPGVTISKLSGSWKRSEGES
jgi:chemotaxis protein MotA